MIWYFWTILEGPRSASPNEASSSKTPLPQPGYDSLIPVSKEWGKKHSILSRIESSNNLYKCSRVIFLSIEYF